VPGSVEKIEIAKARSEGQIKVIAADLELLHKGDESQNVLLEDGDAVMVRKKSGFYDSPRWVTVRGEVKYPGTYALFGKEDKISDVIERAGGLTRYAHPKGAVLTRKREHFPSDEQRRDVVVANKIINALNELEYSRQIARNQWLLQKELLGKAERPQISGTGTPVVATSGTPSEAAAIGMAPGVAQAAGEVAGGIIRTFESAPGVVSRSRILGKPELQQAERVIINLKDALKGRGKDVVLMDGDTIHIPEKVEIVSVVGAITRPTTIHFTDNSKVDYYIQNSGGYTDDANAKRALVMRVDGSIIPADKVKYVEEGDIIYVPPKVISLDIVERIDKVIDVVKFTLMTVSSVAVFITLIGLF
jgi:protein involved in polysaccharide export with SLBB domain